jgi:hypothetical protein
MEHRRFHRVKSTALGDLRHQGITYRVRLENLSLGGALLSSDDCILIPEGDHCSLSIHFEGEELFVLTAEVINSFFSMVGVRFVCFEKGAEDRLLQVLRRIPGAGALEPKSAAHPATAPAKPRFPLLSKSGGIPNQRAAGESGVESQLQAENGSN